MITRLPSYIVAEIPEPVRGEIQALRDRFSTPTARLPVEITLLGSSGSGPILAGTPLQLIRDQIDAILPRITPWKTAFCGIRAFPHTSTAYLAPGDRQPFDQLHELLLASSIPCPASPFPYTPHCTLRSGGIGPGELSQVLDQPFPATPFLIDTISVYDLDPETAHCSLLYQTKLKV